ncbi:sulfatase family protein [Alienimonas chondri]|uniref:Multifunctional alkaline phosphatase superfamily protein n=1 Tax=Alienimonas chondri TaxID=2681879 RepID=A0ABX1V9N7_9PLAN|nr:sulfatase [Alienimonas chondri]NNJ24807.1 Multifunctional alkaline phosphatase superfamily protein [Alienimonas chondri]
MTALLLTAFLAAAPADAAGADAGSPPVNVLFVLTDDHRNDHLGCAGHPVLKTPHIDALAARGVRFENAFVTTSICAASRATILTGHYEISHGFTFGKPPLSKELIRDSYPAVLKRAGYRTGFAGKFGVNTADKQAPAEMFDVYKPINRSPYFHKQPDGSLRHTTDLIGDAAEQFIASTPADQPFCLSLSFNAGHAEDGDLRDHYPYPETEAELYRDEKLPPIGPAPAGAFNALPKVLQESMNRDRWQWRWHSRSQRERNTRDYYRLLSAADRNVGRAVAALEQAGRLENTLVIVTGDNGYYMGSRGLAGKWSHFEESLRVPLVIAGPGVSTSIDVRAGQASMGRVESAVALNVDLPATMLDACGQSVPADYQGRSLVPLLKGETAADWRTDFLAEHRMNNARIPKWQGVRGERWVYANYYEQTPPVECLYDLEADPLQLKNLATDPAFAEDLATMRARSAELGRMWTSGRDER